MRATLYSHSDGADKVVGEVTLDEEGRIEMDPGAHRRLEDLRVFEADGGEVTPADGRRYLLALPNAWRGSYIWTVVTES